MRSFIIIWVRRSRLLGQHELAIASYRRATALAPDEAAIHFNLGAPLHTLHRMPEPVESLERSIALRPNVMLMLPLGPDYRCMLQRADSPWYPTMRLFRQPALHGRPSVVADIVHALDTWP